MPYLSKDWPNDQDSDRHDTEMPWQRRAEMALASAQRANQTITYGELADAAKIPSPHRIHKLTQWLESSMRKDHAAGDPLRAALVISRNRNGLPAPGFFLLCVKLGLHQGATSGRPAVEFHKAAITKLWQKSNP